MEGMQLVYMPGPFQSLCKRLLDCVAYKDEVKLKGIIDQIYDMQGVSPRRVDDVTIIEYLEDKMELCEKFESALGALKPKNNENEQKNEEKIVEALKYLMNIYRIQKHLSQTDQVHVVEILWLLFNYMNRDEDVVTTQGQTKAKRCVLLWREDKNFFFKLFDHLYGMVYRSYLISKTIVWFASVKSKNKTKIIKYWDDDFASTSFEDDPRVPLLLAADAGDLFLLSVLKKKLGMSLFRKQEYESELCLLRALQSDSVLFAKRLIHICSEETHAFTRMINARDNLGYTPLHIACSKNLNDVVRLLIRKRAPYNVLTHPDGGLRPSDLCPSNKDLAKLFGEIDGAFETAATGDLESMKAYVCEIGRGEEDLIQAAVDAKTEKSAVMLCILNCLKNK